MCVNVHVLLTIGTHGSSNPPPPGTPTPCSNVEYWLLFLVFASWTMPGTTIRLLCAYAYILFLHTYVYMSVCVYIHLDLHSCISCVAAHSGAIRSVFGAFSWRIKPEQQPKQWTAFWAAVLQLYKNRPGPPIVHASSALTCGLMLACMVDLVTINFHFLVKLLCSLFGALWCRIWLMFARCRC